MTEKITRREIDEVKRQHILDNLLYAPQDVATLLCISVKSVFRLIDEGELDRANGKIRSGRTRVTARSVERYRIKITSPEK